MSDLEDPKDFIKNLRKSIKKGAYERRVLLFYTFPPEFIGVENILGTLEKDKKA